MKNLFLHFLFFLCLGFTANAQYYTEDLESGIPADWVVDGAFALGTAADAANAAFPVPGHTNFIWVNDDAIGQGVSGNGTATTGMISLDGTTQPGLFMEVYFRDLDYDADETAKVSASNDGGATWTELINMTGTAGWEQVIVPLVDYVGQTVMLRIAYDDGGGWNYGLAFDDLVIDEMPNESISMVSADVNCGLTGSQVGIELTTKAYVKSSGINMLTSVDINISDGTETYTETITGLTAEIGDVIAVDHPLTVAAGEGTNNFEIWFSNPNGVEDPNMADNMASVVVQGYSGFAAGRKVVVEEATGTWCTWCPRGAVYLDRMSECYPDHFIGIAVHNDDPMELAAYDSAIRAESGFPGFPSVLLERESFLNPDAIANPVRTKAAENPQAFITNMAEFDELNNALTVTLEVLMNATIAGDYKLTAVLTEDGLSGTGADWAQVNQYSGGGQGPMGGYEFLPSPVPAELMVYDHVGQALIGGYAGSSNSLPDTLFNGQRYRFTFPVHAIPAAQVMENMHLVGLFTSPAGNIVNAEQNTVQEAIDGFMVSNEEVYINEKATVYPNPFSETLNISLNLTESYDVNMEVYSAIGQKMDVVNYGNIGGNQLLRYDGENLQNGIYFFHIYVGEQLITKKVTVAR